MTTDDLAAWNVGGAAFEIAFELRYLNTLLIKLIANIHDIRRAHVSHSWTVHSVRVCNTNIFAL